jgi:hypothetical protein
MGAVVVAMAVLLLATERSVWGQLVAMFAPCFSFDLQHR